MTTTKFYIELQKYVMKRLTEIAFTEYRSSKQQAQFFIDEGIRSWDGISSTWNKGQIVLNPEQIRKMLKNNVIGDCLAVHCVYNKERTCIYPSGNVSLDISGQCRELKESL